MNNTKKITIAWKVILRLFLYALAVLISIPLSSWSYLSLFFPFISTIIALIFVIKTFLAGKKEFREQNESLGIAYYITACIIVCIQTGIILWYLNELSNIHWQ